MKKVVFLFIFLIVLLSVNLNFVIAENVSQQEKANFLKAGKSLLEEEERILLKEKRGIEKFVQKISSDNVVSFWEMCCLSKKIRRFNSEKERADRELKFYQLKTKTGPPRITAADYRNGKYERIKRYFVQETGRNIKIKINFLRKMLFVLIIIGIIDVIFFIFKSMSGHRKIDEVVMMVATVVVGGFLFLLNCLLF